MEHQHLHAEAFHTHDDGTRHAHTSVCPRCLLIVPDADASRAHHATICKRVARERARLVRTRTHRKEPTR